MFREKITKFERVKRFNLLCKCDHGICGCRPIICSDGSVFYASRNVVYKTNTEFNKHEKFVENTGIFFRNNDIVQLGE
jgi:hypothetical protein